MLETKLPKKREAQKTYPTLCPNRLSAEYQSPLGAQETDGGLQDWARRGRGRPWEAPQASRRTRWRAPPCGQGEGG